MGGLCQVPLELNMVEYTCDEGYGIGEDLNMQLFFKQHFSYILLSIITFNNSVLLLRYRKQITCYGRKCKFHPSIRYI